MTDSTSPIISIRELTKTYNKRRSDPITAVKEVSFDIEQGQIVGLLGPNGAGKTTLVKMILGQVRPTRGEITVNGIDVRSNRREGFKHMSAVLEGSRNLYWRFTVRENVEYFTALQGEKPWDLREDNQRILEAIGIADDADRPIKDLSRGMKQKAAIGCTLARRTPIVFLDEPTLGLDLHTTRDFQNELRRLIKEEDRTVVICSHNMDVIQNICDRILIVQDGSVVMDSQMDDIDSILGYNTYTIVSQDLISEPDLTALSEQFEIVNHEDIGEQTELRILIDDPDEVYTLMRALDELGITLVSISDDFDLGEVFLRIIGEDDREPEPVPTEVEPNAV